MSEIIWQKLVRPSNWSPSNPGDELVGFYLGRTVKHGKWGQYEVAMLAVPVGDGMSRPRMVSGTALLQALDGSGITPGRFLRIVYGGVKDLPGDKHMKMFEVFAAAGDITVEQAREYLAHLVALSEAA
jgi:hypothetical protein